MTDRIHDVVLVGDGDAATELLAAGIHDFFVFDREVVSSEFDDTRDTWTLSTEDGDTCRGRIVITCESPFVPLLPDLMGRRDFRGTAMHAAMPSNFFDPAGKRVAVIGADSSAGDLIDRMAAAGATIEVFPLAPRRTVKRRSKFTLSRRVKVIPAPIEEITAVGVRSADGVHHDADAIVYGTGFAVRAALPHDAVVGARGATLKRDWADGAEPYLGVAMHGFPNYFIAAGPDFTEALRYIVECLQLRGKNTRIEIRRSAQGTFNERVHLRRPSWQLDASAFELSEADDVYRGAAILSVAEHSESVQVQLAGHVDPVDGQYHWQGTIFGPIPEAFKKTRSLTVTIGQRSATARITEQTPQGGHSIAGAGEPPFALEDLQLTGTR